MPSGKIAYDSARQRIICFGSLDHSGNGTPETWEWDGSSWSIITTATSPTYRLNGMMIYDPVREQCVLYGGNDGTWLHETWVYDGTDWTNAAPTHHPHSVTSMYAAWDPINEKVMCFGGTDDPTAYNAETWLWDGTDWAEVTTIHTPPTAFGGCAFGDGVAYLPGSGVVIYGGWFGAPGAPGSFTYLWDGADWSDLSPATVPSPNGRGGPALAIEKDGKVVMWGGNETGTGLLDTWTYDGSNWTHELPSAHPTVSGTNMSGYLTYDAARAQTTLLIAPAQFSNARAETWVWKPPLEVAPTYQRIYGLEIQLTDDGVEGPVTVRTSAQSQQA